ncbi:MAG: cytochrome c-type biosis protein CcmF [Rickettsiaceae bacterium]|jgi:cytochrome c-type biogenesis protein CcmF|nr:cytochrome c-type biosis protein CcmF [Rickettsiaceae bacterium]
MWRHKLFISRDFATNKLPFAVVDNSLIFLIFLITGLPRRFAPRNDSAKVFALNFPHRHCEERSDVAIQKFKLQMIANIGFAALLLSLVISALQPVFSFIFPKNKIADHLLFLKISASAVFLLSAFSFFSLIFCHVISDFSVANVYQNSHSLKPLIYKISGTWGNHEGSMLMLLCFLNFYSLAFAFLSKINDRQKIITLSSQSIVSFGVSAFIAFTSNPFLQLFPIPLEGLGLNPLLQDIGLAMHPPMLYTGYIGFSLIFSIAIAGLLTEKFDKELAIKMRPWLMFSWSFLTLGIGLGSWWAYRELGWGGFWFWDPVENVSLMPWLSATALLHSVAMLGKNNNFKIWSSFLSILVFTFCLLGIFLVRSGIVTSVHSFANDPQRGIFIIILLLIISGTGFLIFFFKSVKLNSFHDQKFSVLSRNGMILINNFLLCLALFIVALGTLYPLILQLFFDSSVSIGPAYYNKLFAPIALIILCLMIFVPSVRLSKFSSSSMALAHIGIFIVIISIALVALFSKTKELNMKFGDKTKIAGYEIEFKDTEYLAGKNYLARQGNFLISKNNQPLTILKPQSRYYPENDQTTTEADIKYFIFADLYLVMGGKDEAENYAVRIYHKPFMSFIWLGCLIIFLGGIFSIVPKSRTKNLI